MDGWKEGWTDGWLQGMGTKPQLQQKESVSESVPQSVSQSVIRHGGGRTDVRSQLARPVQFPSIVTLLAPAKDHWSPRKEEASTRTHALAGNDNERTNGNGMWARARNNAKTQKPKNARKNTLTH